MEVKTNLYVNKRWNEEQMKVRVENLKKVIPPNVVDFELLAAREKADKEIDALYIVYYTLRDRYCKIRRSAFGIPKYVDFTRKVVTNSYEYYTPDNWWWMGYTNASTSSTYYSTTTTTSATSNYNSIWYR